MFAFKRPKFAVYARIGCPTTRSGMFDYISLQTPNELRNSDMPAGH